MTQVTIPFSAHSFEDWQQQLHKELKENTDLLRYSSELEGLDFSLTQLDTETFLPNLKTPVSWKRMVAGNAQNESKSNQYFLQALMQGADALLIDQTSDSTDWSTLLDAIQTPYIACLIVFRDNPSYAHFKANVSQEIKDNVIPLFAYGVRQNFYSTFDVQQIGANCSTQLAVGLHELHQKLKEEPFSQTLFFELGIGSEFFIEIAKLMAFRTLVAQLAQVHACTLEVQVLVKTGFSNKSLADPYTNLLRLSTESLSAILGTANYLCIQPYDALSTTGASDFAKRMALNIGNLLAEEAHLGTLAAPLNGAYTIEKLRTLLIEKSWNLLVELDNDATAATQKIQKYISEARAIRMQRFEQKQDVLIGVNAYANEFAAPKATWGDLPEALGFPYFIIENTILHD